MTPLEACAWIDAAPTPQERARRKDATFHIRHAPRGMPVPREMNPADAARLLSQWQALFPEYTTYLEAIK